MKNVSKCIPSGLVALLLVLSSSLFNLCKAQYTILHSFNDTLGSGPYGSLTFSGKMMYGTTSSGGANKYGCIFSIDTNGNNYKDLFDFNGTNGRYPQGSLTLSGSVLYGMTKMGGANNDGIVFKIDTDGTGYKDLLDFNSKLSPEGGAPCGSLTLSGRKLYGMTSGMFNSLGNIFSVDTNGTGYKDLLDFNGTNGTGPFGSLLILDGVMYGMTGGGGAVLGDDGVIFKIDTDGSGYKDLHNFNDTNGNQPLGSLIISGKVLYGVTAQGGETYADGNIFSIDTTGNNFKDLYDFTTFTGKYPRGTLARVGSVLYGTTSTATGGFNYGYIFSIDTNGNGFENLLTFIGPNGSTPFGGHLTPSGNALYGMTASGGQYGDGVIFKFNYVTAGVSELQVNNQELRVYPNPSNGVFNLMDNSQLTMDNENTSMEIYNTLGQLVYSQSSIVHSQLTINLSNQPSGVYLYRVLAGSGELVGEGKLVIQK